jgi:hypothetical protein
MGRALELSFIALIVIIVAFAIVPWVFARSTKAKRRWGDSIQKGEAPPLEPRDWAGRTPADPDYQSTTAYRKDS